MAIQLTDHARSINLLKASQDVNVELRDNKIIFTITFNGNIDTHPIEKWYMPTKRKFFYTLCRMNVDFLWKQIEKSALMGEEFSTSRPKDYLIKESFVETVTNEEAKWNIEIAEVNIVRTKDGKIRASGDVNIAYRHDDTLETYPMIFQALDWDILSPYKEYVKTQLIDSKYYGVRK